MCAFEYKNDELFCDSFKIADIAQKVGTPFYLYSHQALVDNYRSFYEAFRDVPHLICYAAKTNANIAVLKALAREGAGVDIVSGGELYRALEVGFAPQKIVFAGVGKTEEEISFALKADILMFNVESLPELKLITQVARSMKKKARISFRINPDINPQTHPHIATGLAQNKFGIHMADALGAYEQANNDEYLEIVGIQAHIGSQITTVEPFVETLEKLVKLVKTLEDIDIKIKYIDLGGGLGITYKDETPPTPQEFAQALMPLIKKTKCIFIFEPGRYIAGTAGILVTKILYIKEAQTKKFVIVDAGMNDLARPILYDAYHEILPVKRIGHKQMIVDVVGPICESGDYFAKSRSMPMVEQGELLAIFNAGAYGFSMSSNYNSRPRACEVMVIKNKYYTVRARETFKDLISKEELPGIWD